MEDYKLAMGRRIKQKRKASGLTQEELAELLGISVKHMSEAERGVAGLSVENLIRLTDILGSSLDWLIKGEPEKDAFVQKILPCLRDIAPEKQGDFAALISSAAALTKR